ncbi:unnamed protein product [Calypogeia fissa]
MASSKMVLAVAVTLLAMVVIASACEPVTDFAQCLGYLTGASDNVPKGCCTAVKGDSSQCLCALLSNPPVQINVGKAVYLPSDCGVPVPPNTVCDGYTVPGALNP